MARSRKVTMSDIASKAGVSQATVSLVLNNSNSVKLAESTRQRVLRVASQLGYRHAKAIQHYQRARMIALAVNDITSYDPFVQAISAAQEAAWQHDMLVVTFDYNNDDELAEQIGLEIARGDYVGLIYASSMTRSVSSPRVAPSIPTVLLNCYSEGKTSPVSVLPADKLGAYRAVDHLIEQGHQRIAIILGEEWMQATQQRLAGYRQALINQDIAPNPDWIRIGNWSLKEAYQQTCELLSAPERPEAIFCCSDYMALGCYQAIAQAGLQVPGDIAVAGFDNLLMAQELSPALTSIDLPYSEMGKQAVDCLVDIIHGNRPLRQVKVEGELLVRESTTTLQE